MKIKLDPLDTLFSKFIRLRAMKLVHGCERCLSWKEDYKGLQCSHFFGRAKKSLRWDEDNAVGLCFGCHQYLGSHPHEHLEWFVSHLGEERFEMLLGRVRTLQKPDKDLVALYLNQRINDRREG